MTRYWLAKITDDEKFYYANNNSLWLMQQQYNKQENSAVTNMWSSISQIKAGDYLMLGYGSTIHCIGKICKPRIIPVKHQIASIKNTIGDNKHRYNNGFIIYEDNEVFFEDLDVFNGEWGQRIDVEEWKYFTDDGISNYGIQNGSKNNLSIYTIFEIKENYFKEKVSELRKIYHKNMTLQDRILEILKTNKNIILTGAPGTGKTYLAKMIAKNIILQSDLNDTFIYNILKKYLQQEVDLKSIEEVDNVWQYWKLRILSDDFNITDFANTLSEVSEL